MAELLKTLLEPLEEINAYKTVVEDIEREKFPVHISGCIDTQKCHLIYGLSHLEHWRVIIASNEIKAR